MTGVTSPGRFVQANFYKNNSSWSMPSSCSWGYHCGVTTANGNGNFEIATTLDLAHGDYVYLSIYDAEGNYQYSGQHRVPIIAANLSWANIQGYWGESVARRLTVIHRDGNGGVKWSSSDIWADSWNGEFYVNTSTPIIANDRIDVGNGVYTETMTVQPLTGQLSRNGNHLQGTGINGKLLAQLSDFRRDSNSWWSYCTETNVTNGSYVLNFEQAQVGPQDRATIWSLGSDGHYTQHSAYAFSANVDQGTSWIWGYSKSPKENVSVTLLRNGATVATHNATSFDSGYFYANLNIGTPVIITQGDTVQIQTSSGDSVTILIPEFTVASDPVNNRVYGKSPANQPIQAQSRRHLNWGWHYTSSLVMADGSGNHSTEFNNWYWSRDCSAMDLNHQCSQVGASYYTTDDHRIQVEGPRPQPISADSYEFILGIGDDNTSANARVYSGIQSRTFHNSEDVDWVTFTVPAIDITNKVIYQIGTSNLGWNMATRVDIYNSTMSLLTTWTGYEYNGRGIFVSWQPPSAGTYYLKLSPPDSMYATYCDARYDLSILPVRAKVFLPAVERGD